LALSNNVHIDVNADSVIIKSNVPLITAPDLLGLEAQDFGCPISYLFTIKRTSMNIVAESSLSTVVNMRNHTSIVTMSSMMHCVDEVIEHFVKNLSATHPFMSWTVQGHFEAFEKTRTQQADGNGVKRNFHRYCGIDYRSMHFADK
jgi:hypothetical protein